MHEIFRRWDKEIFSNDPVTRKAIDKKLEELEAQNEENIKSEQVLRRD